MRSDGNDKGIAAQHSGQFIIYECVDMELFLVFIMATLRCAVKIEDLVGLGEEEYSEGKGLSMSANFEITLRASSGNGKCLRAPSKYLLN